MYQFIDAYSSVVAADSSIISGSTHRPIVNIGSVLTAVPTTFSGSPSISGAVTIVGNPSISGTVNIAGNPSVSGTVGASVIGQLPAGTAVLGSVAALQGTNPWRTLGSVSGTVNVQGTEAIGASIASLPVRMGVGDIYGSVVGLRAAPDGDLITHLHSSTIGLADNVTNSLNLVVDSDDTGNVTMTVAPYMFDGLTWDRFRGNSTQGLQVYGSVYGAIAGSVVAVQGGTRITSVVSENPSSLLTGASIFGQLPAGTQMLGSVAAIQGNAVLNIAGSVVAQQLGARTSSIVSSIPSSVLVGTYGHRNDATASFLGGNLTWNPITTDSAGRTITKPFTPDDGTLIEYTGSLVSGSVTLIKASAIGKRNYVTDFWFANTGSVSTLITFKDGSTSVLGYTIAPGTGGSNSQGINVPFKTAPSQDLTFNFGTAVSILYATVRGYQAP